MEHRTESEIQTEQLGRQLAGVLTPGTVIAFTGDLGAGKTTFTQALARSLGVAGRVTSPTFCVVQEHPGERFMVHMDLYRLGGEEDVLELGWEDYLARGAIVVVEWPERAGKLIPASARHIVFTHLEGEESRRLVFS